MNQRLAGWGLTPIILAAACGPDLATRYETGNNALSVGDGAMYFVVISPRLQQILNTCIPKGTPGASPTLVLVADVAANGDVKHVDVQPSSAGTGCVEEALQSQPLHKPPLQPGMEFFPIGLRIDTK